MNLFIVIGCHPLQCPSPINKRPKDAQEVNTKLVWGGWKHQIAFRVGQPFPVGKGQTASRRWYSSGRRTWVAENSACMACMVNSGNYLTWFPQLRYAPQMYLYLFIFAYIYIYICILVFPYAPYAVHMTHMHLRNMGWYFQPKWLGHGTRRAESLP